MKPSILRDEDDIMPIKKSHKLEEVKKTTLLELQLSDQTDLKIIDHDNLPDKYGLYVKDKSYNKRYQKHLYTLFNTIFGSYETPENTAKIVSWILNDITYEKYFVPAVTHITHEADPTKNYETLEFIGDSLWKFTFKDYLIDRYPSLTAKQGTNLNNHYMKTDNQAVLGSLLGLYHFFIADKYIIEYGYQENVAEDMFESFAGAVVQSLKLAGKPEYALKFGKYFFKKVFDNYELNLTSDVDPPKTAVKEIFQKLNDPRAGINIKDVTHMEKEGEETTDDEGRKVYHISVILDNESRETLKRLGYSLPKVLANISGLNKKKLKQDIWNDVLKVLTNVGLSKDFLDKRTESEYKQIDSRYHKMLEKVSKDYDVPMEDLDVFLDKSSNVGPFQVYRLVLRQEGKKDVMLSQIIGKDAKTKKASITPLLDNYFSKK